MKKLIIGMVSTLLFLFVACRSVDSVSDLAEIELVPPAVAAERVSDGQAILVDVREPEEWLEAGVAEAAYLLPLSDLRGEREKWTEFLREKGDRELLLYCRSGNRSGIAAEILVEEGYKIGNIGGFREWQAAGLPVRRVEDPRH